MSGLFREQATLHQRQRLHGSIVIWRSNSFTAMTVSACLACAAVLAFLCIFSVSRTETASGLLVPDRGLLTVTAPQGGVIVDVRVRTDQQVRAGEVLFVLSSEKASTVGDTQLAIALLLDRRIDLLTAEATRLVQRREEEGAGLQQRVQELRMQVDRLEAEIKVQKRRVKISGSELAGIKKLLPMQATSQSQVNDEEAEALDQEARLYSLQRSAAEVRGELAATEAQLQELPLLIAQEQSQLRRQTDELRQQHAENEAQRQVVVRAPRAGQLVGMHVRAGQAVAADAMLASLVPEGSRLQAELSVPSRAMGFVRPGAPVLLRYDAYPYQLFGIYRGTVVEIDRGASADVGSGMHRVLVRLDSLTARAGGRVYPLQPSLKVDATLVLERRRLIEWMLDPLKQLTART